MLAMMACPMAVHVPIMMVGGIVMAMREDLGLSWLVVVVVPVLSVWGVWSPTGARASASCRAASTT